MLRADLGLFQSSWCKERTVSKCLGVMIAGIFVGAVGMELLCRQYPGAFGKLHTKVRKMTSGAKEAFKAGYDKVRQPEEPVAEPSV